jgi:hypothetical protein
MTRSYAQSRGKEKGKGKGTKGRGRGIKDNQRVRGEPYPLIY